MQNTTNTQHHPQTTHATHTINHTPTTPTSPSPLSLSPLCMVCCVRHVTCTVCGGWHSPTHCPAVLHPLCSFLSVPLSSTTTTQKNTGGVEREEREKGVDGERERKRKKRGVMQKQVEKRGQKREKEITTPGVPRLSPTFVQTRPEEASLH